VSVVVVGGGVVGMFTAYYLRKEGIEVTLVESNGLGHGSVHAAGLIEPYRFDRINTTQMVAKMFNYMRRGITKVRKINKEWLSQLLLTLNREPPPESWEIMKEMASFSLREYAKMSEERDDFGYSQEGLYEVYGSKEKIEEAIQEERRSPFRSKVEVRDFQGFAGALYYPELSHVSTELFVERMKRELNGIKLVKAKANSIYGSTVNTQSGEVKGDTVVISTGISLSSILPITAFKGYGYRVKGTGTNVPAVLAEEGVAVVPLKNWFKVTWGFEADYGPELSSLRENPLVKVESVVDATCGHRPCSPDGFPILFKKGEVVVATGNCRLRWSYGPAMGKYAADLALNRVDRYPYLDRYGLRDGPLVLG